VIRHSRMTYRGRGRENCDDGSVAPSAGFEPAPLVVETPCSIQLSYEGRRIKQIKNPQRPLTKGERLCGLYSPEKADHVIDCRLQQDRSYDKSTPPRFSLFLKTQNSHAGSSLLDSQLLEGHHCNLESFMPSFASPMNQGSWYTRKSPPFFTAPFATRRIHRIRRMADLLHDTVFDLSTKKYQLSLSCANYIKAAASSQTGCPLVLIQDQAPANFPCMVRSGSFRLQNRILNSKPITNG
jgi:hypothetical protein